jgi:flagellar biosynthesis protein FlhA
MAEVKTVQPPRWITGSDLALPIGVCIVLAGMVAPVTPLVLDAGISFSLALSIAVVVTSASTKRALEFSAFPAVLLIATLLRLSLNVASTRLILLHGNSGPQAAGRVIESFGRVLVGGNYAVGIVVFIVLAIINFAVITRGASRVAEVAARFTLDAMPGKQMAIDADLNAGMVGEKEARDRRRELSREADFYAAMDGIGKFVRGDAVAAILIMVVNLIAGLFIGGLAAQIPALLTSTAAGLIVSRTASELDLPETIGAELLRHPASMFGTAGLLALAAMMPGLPHLPFMAMAGVVGALGVHARRRATVLAAVDGSALKPGAETEKTRDPWPEPIRLELGAALVPFVNEPWKLADKVQALRSKIRDGLGITLPPVRIADNLALDQNVYRIMVRGTETARGELRPSMSLAIVGPKGPSRSLRGIDTTDPAFGLPALWIAANDISLAKSQGYTVVDPMTVLLTHFSEIVRSHASELLTRKEVEGLIEQAQKIAPRIVEELSGLNIHLGAVYRVLQTLLAQRISIRDLPTILEALAAEGGPTKDPAELAERIRSRIGRIICEPLRSADGTLRVLVADPSIESPFFEALAAEHPMPASAEVLKKTTEAIGRAVAGAGGAMEVPTAVVSPQIRRMFERAARRATRSLIVLGATDIPPGVMATIVGRIA